ncbi:hypothetical protein ACFVVU_15095 [Kitasatospora sp. NPDC057965]|uniref:hypothetical protein n=1 Tax=Kitasatospora sp. NPDC057965 TaxID=3346291 RepID=UPI0036DD1879
MAKQVIGWSTVRWGKVTGHRRAAPDCCPATCVEEHFLIARPGSCCQQQGPGLVTLEWVSRRDLSPYLVGAELRASQALVDGYLDGWLPDGDFTLD